MHNLRTPKMGVEEGGGGNFFKKKSVGEGQKSCLGGGLVFPKAVEPWLGKWS